ncbi:MAG: hydrogenase/urease maturation nickel metallochaperone HypA [Caldilineaceae bacterium]
MHEHHITQQLLQTALDQADLRDGERIQHLDIALNPDGGYTEDSIRFYFEQLAQGTGAAGAELTFRFAPVPQQVQLLTVQISDAPATQNYEIETAPSVPQTGAQRKEP